MAWDYQNWPHTICIQFKGDVLSASCPADVVGFLEQDFCFKSIATQIIHDAALTPNCHARDQTRGCCVSGSDSLCDGHINIYLTEMQNVGSGK